MTTLTDRRRIVPEVDFDTHPLLSPVDSDSHIAGNSHRRLAGKNGCRPRPARQRSLTKDIGHVAAETYLITRLTFTLLQYLGIGYRWITKLLALGCYAMLLMPGFLQVAYYYIFSNKVKRSVVYGDQPRNRLDLYLPADIDKPKPVLIFVTGGAWIIGYKAWGSLLGLQLAERDILVACIDYRIYLMGQSAGAHISSCALLDQAIREYGKGDSVSWSISQIKAYFGLSGGYNLLDLVDHFHNRGLYRSIFLSIMEGEESLKKFSPEIKILDPSIKDSIPHLPPIILFHGTADYSIPSDASKRFADALKKAGARTELILYDGKTHTDLFLQDPLRGGKDDLFNHIVAVIHSDDNGAFAKDAATAPPRRRLVPEILLKLARKISPF